MRWWHYFVYAHDPVSRAALTDLLARFGRLEEALEVRRPSKPIALDCGHDDTGWATDKRGKRWCRACSQSGRAA